MNVNLIEVFPNLAQVTLLSLLTWVVVSSILLLDLMIYSIFKEKEFRPSFNSKLYIYIYIYFSIVKIYNFKKREKENVYEKGVHA